MRCDRLVSMVKAIKVNRETVVCQWYVGNSGPESLPAQAQAVLDCVSMPCHIGGFCERVAEQLRPRRHEQYLIQAVYIGWLCDWLS